MLTFKRTALAATIAALATPAMADLYGGGATLPAKAYLGAGAGAITTDPRLNFPAPGSLFAEGVPGVNVSYCQTGSSQGRRVATGVSATTADDPCPATFAQSPVAGTTGFSAPTITADFAGSDEPATSSDFTNYRTTKGGAHGQMTQFPSVAGSLAIIVNTPGAGSSNIYLTEAEICNIWAGTITRWGQLAKADGLPFGAVNKAITVVNRSDGSGTTYSFTNHMNWVCSDAALNETLDPAASPLPLAANFSVNSAAWPAWSPTGALIAGMTVASGSGNPGVVSQVNAIDGAIGYAEAANAVSEDTPNVKIAFFAPKDAASELNPNDGTPTARVTAAYRLMNRNPELFTIPATFTDKNGASLKGAYYDRVLPPLDGTLKRPVGLPTAISTTNIPVPNCVVLVHPGAYATAPYKVANDPTSGYVRPPIVGITYLLGNHSGNPVGPVTEVEVLIGAGYNAALRPSNAGPVDSVGKNTGFAFLAPFQAERATDGVNQAVGQNRVNLCHN